LFTSNTYLSTQDVILEKSQTAHGLYDLLLSELYKLGPVHETKKAISISFSSDDQKAFAWVIIRNRSIKLVFRTNHRITSQRIQSVTHVADKIYDHTILLDSKIAIDEELMKWLEDAYQTSK
jgi:Domain of unknown function (DUF5655)